MLSQTELTVSQRKMPVSKEIGLEGWSFGSDEQRKLREKPDSE
jgi:hypothetical protein